MTVALRHLGRLPVARFMREVWQRRPLLIRGALPDAAVPGPRDLLQLARRSDAEARLIEQKDGHWQVTQGPLARLPAARRPGWTVLVQGVDLLDARAHALLQRFRFVPDARLDDLMMSYATDGGGVGPHVDSYDVFLLQTHGQRRWRISRQRDLRLVPGAPLRLLANFRATEEHVLEPGDMLYLPPGVAHEGTALGECITASIGFRAPTYQELLEPYFTDFASHIALPGRYHDASQPVARRAAALPPRMVAQLHHALAHRRPHAADTARFLLGHLSEPKAQVVFDAPVRPLGARAFAAALGRRGLLLDRRTRLLYHGRAAGINGEVVRLGSDARATVQRLADVRALPAAHLGAAALELLHAWYRAGWLHLASKT